MFLNSVRLVARGLMGVYNKVVNKANIADIDVPRSLRSDTREGQIVESPVQIDVATYVEKSS